MTQYREALSAEVQIEARTQQTQNECLLGLARMRRGIALLCLEREEEGAQVLEEALPLFEASEELKRSTGSCTTSATTTTNGGSTTWR